MSASQQSKPKTQLSEKAPAADSGPIDASHGGINKFLRRWNARVSLQSQGLVLMLVGLVTFFTIRSPFFLTTTNLLNIAAGSAVLGIMAAAQTFLIIGGGFDVSVGATVAVSTVTLGIFLDQRLPVLVAIALVLLIGLMIGAVNGFLIVILKINPLIATLGTMSIFTGLAFLLSSGQARVVRNEFLRWLTVTKVGPVHLVIFLLLGVYAFGIVFERMTVHGRRVYAIGGNEEASLLAGLPVQRMTFVLYMVSGLSAAVGGIILTGLLGSSSPQVGGTFLLSVITAVILGGTSLYGGRGSLVGTLAAVAILGILNNGFSLLLLPSYIQTMSLGVALIIAVLLDGAVRKIELI